MKKLLTAALVLLAALCGVLGFAACGEQVPSSSTEHFFSAWTTVTEATCFQEGLEERYCADCNRRETRPIPIDESKHVFDEGEVTLRPTCTTAGETTFTCEKCGKKKVEPAAIDPAAHEWDIGAVTTAPTCTKTGIRTYTCLHDKEHTRTEVIEANPSVHNWDTGVTTVAATCTDRGVRTYTCLDCKTATRTEEIEIDESNHAWDTGMETTAPTCTTPGEKTFTCTHNPDHKRYEEIAVDTEAHKWAQEGVETKPATCSEKGIMTYTCEHDPNHKKEVDIEIVEDAHLWDQGTITKNATCSERGVTRYVCSYNTQHTKEEPIEINPSAHKLTEHAKVLPQCTVDGNEQYWQCDYCHNYYLEKEATQAVDQAATVLQHPGHSYGEWIIDTPATCIARGAKHKECENCDSEEHDTIEIDLENGHVWGVGETTVEMNCHQQGNIHYICTLCADHSKDEVVEINAEAHVWGDRTSNNNGTHKRTCTVAGCNVSEAAADCDYLETLVEATCETDGYTRRVCRYCNYEAAHINLVPKYEHNNYAGSEWIPDNEGNHYRVCPIEPQNVAHRDVQSCSGYSKEETLAADCETNGYLRHVCTVCQYVIDNKVKPMLHHDFEGPGRTVDMNPGSKYHVLHCAHNPDHTKMEQCEFSDTKKTDATCNDPGYTTYTCPVCKDSYQDDREEALGHQWKAEYTPSQANFEGEENSAKVGTHTSRCTRCEEVNTEPCQYNTEGIVTASTCSKKGYTTVACTFCGHQRQEQFQGLIPHTLEYINNSNGTHTVQCAICKGANGDKQSNVSCDNTMTAGDPVAPTCTAQGYTVYTCSLCGYHTNKDIKGMVAHSYPEGGAYHPAAEKPGYHTRTCSVCSTEDTQECKFDDGKETAPTCTAAGFTTFECPTCHYTRQEDGAEATGHKYEKATWHAVDSYGKPLKQHYHDCDVCGEEGREVATCTGFRYTTVDSTCYQPGHTDTICDLCGGTTTEALELAQHTWGTYKIDGDSGHHRECTVEGCTAKEDVQSHNLKDASTLPTCQGVGDVKSMCEDCGYVKDLPDIPALGHQYDDEWTYDTQKPGFHYRDCTVCGEAGREEQPCVTTSHTTDATCTKASIKTETCTSCQHKSDPVEVQAALGHDYGPWMPDGDNKNHTKTCQRENCDDKDHNSVTAACNNQQSTVEASCSAAGKYVYTCPDCHNSYDGATIPKKAHSYSEKWTNAGKGLHFRTCTVCGDVQSGKCTDQKEVTPSGCDTRGYTTHTCPLCKNSYRDSYTSATGHQLGNTVTKSTNGKTHTRTCTKCKKQVAENCQINVSTVLGDCVTPDQKVTSCLICGYSKTEITKVSQGHSFVFYAKSSTSRKHIVQCSVCSTREEADCEYDEKVVAATCTRNSYHIHTCKVCNDVYEHDVEGTMTEHNYGIWSYNGEGVRTHTHTCVTCGKQETKNCKKENGRKIEGDCTTNTVTSYTCPDCQGTFTETSAAAPGHDWGYATQAYGQSFHTYMCRKCHLIRQADCTYKTEGEDATCTSSGRKTMICTVCANKIVKSSGPLGHDWGDTDWQSDGKGHHYRTCRRQGCNMQEYDNCQMVPAGKAATCQDAGKDGEICSKCGYSVGVKDTAALNHDYSEWAHIIKEGVHYHTRYCKRHNCGYTEEQACSVNTATSQVTCETPESVTLSCDVCHFSETNVTQEKLGHKWIVEQMTDSTHKSRCERCNITSEKEHTFTESNICDGCTYDGLNYELVLNDHYKVVDDNKVLGAKHIVIPEKFNGNRLDGKEYYPVKEIENYAFYRHPAVETVVLPRCLTTIGEAAFQSCEKLQVVSYAEGEEEIDLTMIGRFAFMGCSKLSTFPFKDLNKLTTIGIDAFRLDAQLKDITLSDSVLHLGSRAFAGTILYKDASLWEDRRALYLGHHLVKVNPQAEKGDFEVRENTISIGEAAFENCNNIERLTLHKGLTLIDSDAFKNVESIESLEFDGTLADWLKISFGNDLSSPLPLAKYFHIAEATGNVTIPADKSVTAIPAGMFYNDKELTEITIPANITTIGDYAFYGCTKLKKVTFVDCTTITSIGLGAFEGTQLYTDKNSGYWQNGLLIIDHHLIAADNEKIQAAGGEVKLENIITISPRAFYHCTALTKVTIPRTVTWIGKEAFSGSGLKAAVFEGASTNDKEPNATEFFASSLMQMGRWEDTLLAHENTAAILLTTTYQGYWRRTGGGQPIAK